MYELTTSGDDWFYAMALVEGGLGRQGEAVRVVVAPDRAVRAIIGTSRFYDPEGVRLHG